MAGSAVVLVTADAPAGLKDAALAAPVTLAANTSYDLLSQDIAGGDPWSDSTGSTAGSSAGP